jgi:hypothetical protein
MGALSLDLSRVGVRKRNGLAGNPSPKRAKGIPIIVEEALLYQGTYAI